VCVCVCVCVCVYVCVCVGYRNVICKYVHACLRETQESPNVCVIGKYGVCVREREFV